MSRRKFSTMHGLGSQRTQPAHEALSFFCPYFPRHRAGDFGFRSGWAYDGDAVSSTTRALRIVASACIPIGMLRRKRRHVSARILQTTLQDIDQSSTARHYRQAKQNSQNLFNIPTGLPGVNSSTTKYFSDYRKVATRRLCRRTEEAVSRVVPPLTRLPVLPTFTRRLRAGLTSSRRCAAGSVWFVHFNPPRNLIPATRDRVPPPRSLFPAPRNLFSGRDHKSLTARNSRAKRGTGFEHL